MMYVIKLANQDVLLDNEAMDKLLEIFDGAWKVQSEYVGSGKGDDGANYIKVLRRLTTETDITLTAMSNDRFDALMLKTKLYDENK
jgi:hypothetical protein